jgi:two-component system CheB/CheR fusion protein
VTGSILDGRPVPSVTQEIALPASTHDVAFPVVGVGASAGGVEAISALVGAIPAKTRAAVILLQHLDRDHRSPLAELLAGLTSLEVIEAENGTSIEEGCVYVTPPGYLPRVKGGCIELESLEGAAKLNRPIDALLSSLAEECGPSAAGVLLSGTGSDGSAGFAAIKEVGGICVAQDPRTARFGGMPEAGISTGCVDLILPPQDIVREIVSFFARRKDGIFQGDDDDRAASVLREVLAILSERVGHDFSGYKHSTLFRRIERRMQVRNEIDTAAYIALLRSDRDECEALFHEFLINVTKFFRDPDHFELLRREVIVPLAERPAGEGEEIRVWVPGCSSGQEAYTIAMLLAEAMGEAKGSQRVQVFATDIDESMIRIARKGCYPISALEDIPERLRNAYTHDYGDEFQIAPQIRDMVRFSVHSIIKHPPFLKLDLVSCRNLFIYFGDDIQHSLTALLHYGLKPGGHLFLGPSEGISQRESLFETVDQKTRLYRRKDTPRSYPIDLPIGLGGPGQGESGASGYIGRPRGTQPTGQRAASHAAILERYAPVFVRVTTEGDIVSSVGDLSSYLKSAPGDQDQHISRLARGELRHSMQLLISRVKESGERKAMEDVTVSTRFGSHTVDVVADPMADGTIAIVFIETGRFKEEFRPHYIEADTADDRIVSLEQELRSTRQRLRGTVEELETANEELKSSNEEMMSMNEELQSANEELSTLNDELKAKISELGVANDDLINFFRSASIALIVVDEDLQVRLFSDQARSIFAFSDDDRGRSLTQITRLIDEPSLLDDVRETIERWRTVERMVVMRDDGRIFQMRIFPYRSTEGGRDGATLVFNDMTEVKALEADLQLKTERLALALDAGKMGVWEYDVDTGESIYDPQMGRLFDLEPDQQDFETAVSRILPEDRDEAIAAFQRTIETGERYEHRFRLQTREGSIRWIMGVGERRTSADGRTRLIGLNYDITFEEEARERQVLMVEEMNHRVKNLFAVIASLINTTAAPGRDVLDYARQLNLRVNALGRAYELTQNKSADAKVGLQPLLTRLLKPHTSTDRLSLSGGPVEVPVDAVTPMSLIVHELATNAVKYGAWSTEGGIVAVTWSLHDENELELQWNEKLTKSVHSSSGVPSFGTRLVDASVRQMRGTVERNWTENGLVATFRLRLPAIKGRRG